MAIRGIGPSLTQSGLSNVLADPTLELHDSNGTTLVSNDNWQDDPASASQLSVRTVWRFTITWSQESSPLCPRGPSRPSSPARTVAPASAWSKSITFNRSSLKGVPSLCCFRGCCRNCVLVAQVIDRNLVTSALAYPQPLSNWKLLHLFAPRIMQGNGGGESDELYWCGCPVL